MTDPYKTLHDQLRLAARRLESPSGSGRLRAWLSRRTNASLAALGVLLSGGAVALAASGILSGSPVPVEKTPSPTAGNGLPVAGATLAPVLATPDPAGGLPWGARVFETTRGQVCIQVGRLKSAQLGELGLDSAFGSDGRFHPLPANVLPPGYGGAAIQGECVAAGSTVVFENDRADRSGAELLPEEFPAEAGDKNRKVPPIADLRALAYGVLGAHAVSVTYRTPEGLRTAPVARPSGAFLVVEPAASFKSNSLIGGSILGRASARSVLVLPPGRGTRTGLVTAATFRFGAKLCSVGVGSSVTRPCPQKRVEPPRRWFQPTRSLGLPVRLTALPQPAAACRRAFLLVPCYRGEVSFTAPYAVENAVADYSIDVLARCSTGGRPEGGWSVERDVSRGEHVRTLELGLFVFTPSCAPHETFRVVYQNTPGPSRAAPHESVIVGQVSMSRAHLPGGGAPARPQSR